LLDGQRLAEFRVGSAEKAGGGHNGEENSHLSIMD
jgi:hypothetical protein